MNDSAQRMKIILTKDKLYPDELLNYIDTPTLLLMMDANRILIKKMALDEMLITTEAVKKIVKDDIDMAKLNMKVIESTIRLREHYRIESFCLN
jgi:hypothetical protein